MAIALRQSRVIPHQHFVGWLATVGAVDTYANLLLSGETDGFAIDATDVSASPSFAGAPYAGYVSVKDTGTPANNLSNVSLDSSNLVQAGTSPKMVHFNASPYVRWSPHNLLTYSQAFDNAAWAVLVGSITKTADSVAAPDGSTTADTFTGTGASPANAYQTITLTAGVAYTYSWYAKISSGNYIRIGLNDNGGNYAVKFIKLTDGTLGTTLTGGTGSYIAAGWTDVGSGWVRVYVTFSDSSGGSCKVDVFFSSADNTECNNNVGYLWGAQVVKGYNANPYIPTTSAAVIGIPQSYDTAASKFGILVEPAGTNVQLHSEVFSSWNTTTNLTLTADTAPDGTSTATKLTNNTTNGDHRLFDNSFTYNGGSAYTYSIYAKAGTTNWLQIFLYDGAYYYANFDLSNGTIGNKHASVTASTVSVGGGWYRCIGSISATFTGNPSNLQIYVLEADTASAAPAYAGTTKDLSIWGAQVETGSVATSYIPTLGSTVTRAVDDVHLATSSIPYSATASTVIAWFKPLRSPTNGAIFSLDQGGSSHRAQMRADALSREWFCVAPGTAQFDIISGTYTVGTAAKSAGTLAANDAEFVADGSSLGTDGSVTMPDAATDFGLGNAHYATSTFPMNAYIYQVTYLNRRATQAQMITKTT